MGNRKECQTSAGSRSPLLATREVLADHLKAQIRSIQPGLEDPLTDTVTQGATNEDIIGLLCDANRLRAEVDKAVMRREISWRQGSSSKRSSSDDHEELGEQLFLRVALIDSELCAQITGMLLELDSSEITRLLNSPPELAIAVAKAKVEYVRYMHGVGNSTNEKSSFSSSSAASDGTFEARRTHEVIGEILYSIVAKEYPDEAPRITGMLLEMDCSSLQKLLDSPSELRENVRLALEALQSSS